MLYELAMEFRPYSLDQSHFSNTLPSLTMHLPLLADLDYKAAPQKMFSCGAIGSRLTAKLSLLPGQDIHRVFKLQFCCTLRCMIRNRDSTYVHPHVFTSYDGRLWR